MVKTAIIVTYKPNNTLNNLINMLVQNDINPIIIDNSPNWGFDDFIVRNCKIIQMETNCGIAYAQNKGISYAIENYAEILLFFDQDSFIETSLLTKLTEPIEFDGFDITAPIIIDIANNFEYPSYKILSCGLPYKIYRRNNKTGIIDIAVSSGLTVKANVFVNVGFFDEDFFIDFVDIEWCLRARKKFKILLVNEAIMYHKIGKRTVKFLGFNYLEHTPIRTYYKVRNSFLLLRKNVNIIFSITQILSALIHNFLGIFTAKEKKKQLIYYLLGIRDGLIDMRGKLKNEF